MITAHVWEASPYQLGKLHLMTPKQSIVSYCSLYWYKNLYLYATTTISPVLLEGGRQS